MTRPRQPASPFRYFKPSPEISRLVVMMYVRFPLSLRNIKRALKRHGSPEAITTDGLRSYKAAMSELGNAEEQEVGRWADSRCENSHLSFRRRERAMLRFRRMKTLQKFASVHADVHNHNFERHLVGRKTYMERRSAALAK